jgi:Lhr-like helicase
MLQQWVNGKVDNHWIITTSGLETDIDIEGIVTIIHMRQPYKLVDFIQQTDRGKRRNSKIVDSVIVTNRLSIYYNEFDSDID